MIVAVTGTGTGVGKTHVACALVGALRELGVRALGWKPVESGVAGERGDDEALLYAASGGIAAPTIRLRAALSPHLAARRERIALDAAGLRRVLAGLCAGHAAVVVELAGGLWSPFDDALDNADWLATLPAPRVVVVAPDRLGVLHDCSATARAARHAGLALHAVVLSPPAEPDASTGSNAGELRVRPATRELHVASVPRAPIEALRSDPEIAALARTLIG